MTCKDCYHYQICPNKDNLQSSVYGEAERCKDFKNKDKVVELPCAIGDEAYLLVFTNKDDPAAAFINTVKVVGLHLFDEKNRRGLRRGQYLVVRGSCGFSSHITINRIGDTVFFSREEANKRLERLRELYPLMKEAGIV